MNPRTLLWSPGNPGWVDKDAQRSRMRDSPRTHLERLEERGQGMGSLPGWSQRLSHLLPSLEAVRSAQRAGTVGGRCLWDRWAWQEAKGMMGQWLQVGPCAVCLWSPLSVLTLDAMNVLENQAGLSN